MIRYTAWPGAKECRIRTFFEARSDWARLEPPDPEIRNKRARQNVIAPAFVELEINADPHIRQIRAIPA
jgi:hypothetical protein